jgi:hypothetical protein
MVAQASVAGKLTCCNDSSFWLSFRPKYIYIYDKQCDILKKSVVGTNQIYISI